MSKRMRISAFVAFAVLILCAFPLRAAHADEQLKIVEPLLVDDMIQVFLKGTQEAEEPEVLAGTSVGKIEKIEKISEGNNEIYTLVLVDNSNSIKETNKKKTAGILNSMILGRLPNEKIAVATYDDKNANYLCDYIDDGIALKDAVSKIEYSTHSSFLTDILYELINKTTVPVNAYWRIVVISDGSDRNGGKYQTTELDALLNEKLVPVYTLCCYEKNKDPEDRKWLASLSRFSCGRDFELTDSDDVDQIARELREEAKVVKLQFTVPNELLDGTKKSVKITVSGMSDSREIRMPQKYIEPTVTEEPSVTEEPQVTEETDVTEKPEITEEPDEKDDEEKEAEKDEDNGEDTEDTGERTFLDFLKENAVIIGICGGVILLAVIVIIIVLCTGRKKKKRFTIIAPPANATAMGKGNVNKNNNFTAYNNAVNQNAALGYPEVQNRGIPKVVDMPQNDGSTIQVFDERGFANDSFIVLKKVDGTFEKRLPIKGEITIGRKACDCTIDFDNSVSSRHCAISKISNRYYIRDLNSTNGVVINGVKIGSDFELVSGTEFTIGRTTLRFEVLR